MIRHSFAVSSGLIDCSRTNETDVRSENSESDHDTDTDVETNFESHLDIQEECELPQVKRKLLPNP